MVWASSIKSLLPLPELLNNTPSNSFPSLERVFDPINDAIEFKKSIWETISSDTCGLIFPFQYVINGTRVPASKRLYLPPLKFPEGVWFPSFSIASS